MISRINLSLYDRASLLATISFIQRFLAEDGTMSPAHRKRALASLKRYQEALETIEALLIETGGIMIGDAE